MDTDKEFWNETPEQARNAKESAGTISERLIDQFDTLKQENYFDAVRHNILRDRVQEIWTTNLLQNAADIGNRLNKLGYDLSPDEYKKIFNAIHDCRELSEICRNINKSVLLTIDPNDSSQEAVESFLEEVNSKYGSKFTLEDFDAYARNRVFADADQELIEQRKIEFAKKFENEKIVSCTIPQKVSLESILALDNGNNSDAILDGFLNKDAPTLITASGGTGKSALVLNMMLALGSPDVTEWMGFKKVESKYTSMIVQQEDSQYTITERLRLMCKDPAMKGGIDSISFVGDSFKVANKSLSDDTLTDYITENIKNMFINGEEIPDLLILDSLSVFAGASENDSMSMRGVTNKLFSLCSKFGMTPIVIHHHGKETNSNSRGSTAIVDSFRCHYTLRPVGGEKEDKMFRDIGCGETVHLNRIKRPKANDLYGNFNLVYICNNMIFKTEAQAMEAVGKTPESKKNAKLQKIRDIVEDKVLGSEELTNLIMDKLETSKRTAMSGMSKAVTDEYIYKEKIGRNSYYFTNEDDFDDFKEKTNE